MGGSGDLGDLGTVHITSDLENVETLEPLISKWRVLHEWWPSVYPITLRSEALPEAPFSRPTSRARSTSLYFANTASASSCGFSHIA